MKVYVFRGKDGSYGLTPLTDGANLPSARAPWGRVTEIDMNPGENPRAAVNTELALADIARDGFHLTTVKITFTEKE